MTTRTVRHVVLQATPYCNLDCSYCYLPDRSRYRLMEHRVLHGTIDLLERCPEPTDIIELRWHAGEPMAAGRPFYVTAFGDVERRLGHRFEIRHSLQTNATLITDEWCRFLLDHDVRVGVSIDGPRHLHDRARRTRAGRGTFDLALRGVDRLRRHGVPFETISVLGADTVARPSVLLDFLESLQPRLVGLNVEESEGTHRSTSLGSPTFERELRLFFDEAARWERRSGIPIRELDRIRQRLDGEGYREPNDQVLPFRFLNIDVDGGVHTFSPELVGMRHHSHPSFVLGSVWSPWEALLTSERLLAQETAIRAGVRRCEQTCGYWAVCGGGAPVNKLYENDTFDSAETAMCRCTVQYPADAVVAQIEASGGAA